MDDLAIDTYRSVKFAGGLLTNRRTPSASVKCVYLSLWIADDALASIKEPSSEAPTQSNIRVVERFRASSMCYGQARCRGPNAPL